VILGLEAKYAGLGHCLVSGSLSLVAIGLGLDRMVVLTRPIVANSGWSRLDGSTGDLKLQKFPELSPVCSKPADACS